MRLYAFLCGVWFSSFQLCLIFAVSFLHSATFPAYLSTMGCWFLGSALGVRLPARWPNFCLCAVAVAAHLGGVPELGAILGGLAGGQWVRRWAKNALAQRLSYETAGMAAGTALVAVCVYRFGMSGIYTLPCIITLLVARLEWGQIESESV